MSAKYGTTICLSGKQENESKCFAELTASLRTFFTDSDGHISYTLPQIPGSYWTTVRRGGEELNGNGIIVTYMLTIYEFWSSFHDSAIKRLAEQWPSLTLFMYGDSFENRDGFRILCRGGKLIVDDTFLLDESDRATDVRRRFYGEGMNDENLALHLQDKYSEDFLCVEDNTELPTWSEVRAEVEAAIEN